MALSRSLGSSTSFASVIAALRRPPGLSALFGDSRAEQGDADSTGAGRNKAIWNYYAWLAAMTGQRLIRNTGMNFGKSGERNDQIILRVPNVIASGAGIVFAHMGLNSIAAVQSGGNFVHAVSGQTITSATINASILADAKYAVDAFTLAGINTVFFLDSGSSNLNATGIGMLNRYNADLRAYAETNARLFLVDAGGALRDPSASTASQLAYRSGAMRNESGIFTHTNTLGAYYEAKAALPIINALVPPLPQHYADAGDTYNASTNPAQLCPNAGFTSIGGTLGTGGSLAGTNGGVPAGYNCRRSSGSGTFTSAVQDRADGLGKEWVLAFTLVSGDDFRIQYDVPIANWSPGDVLQGLCEIVVDQGPTGFPGAYMSVEANGDSQSITAIDFFSDSLHGPWPAEAVPPLQLATTKLTLPNWSAKGYCTFYIQRFVATANGAVTIRIRAPQLKKRL